MSEQIEGFHFTCMYSDCPLHRLEDDRPFTGAARWAYLRTKYHPEYPATPEFGVRYPMPEFRERVANREPQNPYLAPDLDAAYRQMAREEFRETEAGEWAEATMGDVGEVTQAPQ